MAVLTVKNALDNGSQKINGSLRETLRLAKSGDTIRFSPALKNKTIKLTRNFSIDKNITIDASQAPGMTLDGNKKYVIFSVKGKAHSFKVKGLTLENAFHGYNGAAIRVMIPNAKLRVEDSQFRNNTAGYGGAIWAKTNADVTVLNSQFYGNRSTVKNDTSAGAISVFDQSKLLVKGSEFVGNRGVSGGAVGTIFTEVTIEDSVFRNNKSVKWSGAVHADGATIPAQERYYSGPKKRARKGKNIIIRNSQFYNNTSPGHGGAVGVWGYDQDFVTIAGNSFVGNRVTKDSKGLARGGAIRVSGKKVTIAKSRFERNISTDEGGAVWHQGESPTIISETVFSKNIASAKGGAIYNHQWNGPGTTITNSTFRSNRAPAGGAIYKHRPRPITVTGSLFKGNGSNEIGGETAQFVQKSSGKGASSLSSSTQAKASTNITTPKAPLAKTSNPVQSTPSELLTNSSNALVASIDFNHKRGRVVADRSANGNNKAYLHNGATSAKGISGKALSLTGKSQFAGIKNSKDINTALHKQRTVSFWFNANDASTEAKKQVLYEEGAAVRGLNVYLHDDLLYFGGWNTPKNESGWQGTWLKTNRVSSKQWHHVALVLDGGSQSRANALTAFLDGERVAKGDGSQLWAHSGGIGLGSINDQTRFHDGLTPQSGQGFAGKIDEVNIFNSALNANQIQSLAAI